MVATQESKNRKSTALLPRKRPPALHATPSSSSTSVRPTELPATITDERTDWRKLLKPQDDAPTSPPPPPPPEPMATTTSARTQSTKAFIAELRAIVKTLQQHELSSTRRAPMRNSGKLSVHGGIEQLQRQVDALAAQLEALEPVTSSDSHESAQLELNALSLRWEMVSASSRYGAERVSDVDKQLGMGVDRLLKAQRLIVEALLRHASALLQANAALSATHNSSSSGGGGGSSDEQKQQMTILLDVAETLERDLEALQSRFHAEKAQREKTEQENAALRQELETLKLKLTKQPTTISNSSSSGGKNTPRALRRRAPESPSKTAAAVKIAAAATGHQVIKTKAKTVPAPMPNAKAASPQEAPEAVSKRPSSPLVPEAIRSLTLKQLVDLIHCIIASKSKYDARTREVGAPPETMEQHMYTYLTQRFGLQRLTVEYASAIWKGCQLFTRDDNDVAVFHALLRNRVDEGFLAIKRRLRDALRELLRAYFHARFPMKPEPSIQRLVESRLKGDVLQEEWTELLLYLYDPSDVSIVRGERTD
ncbi:hypothetical protein PINS_up011380 [Pythium insidiosum]|nr:hypothetical protein PINS_up011380 [Pythium insidiosum]